MFHRVISPFLFFAIVDVLFAAFLFIFVVVLQSLAYFVTTSATGRNADRLLTYSNLVIGSNV